MNLFVLFKLFWLKLLKSLIKQNEIKIVRKRYFTHSRLTNISRYGKRKKKHLYKLSLLKNMNIESKWINIAQIFLL